MKNKVVLILLMMTGAVCTMAQTPAEKLLMRLNKLQSLGVMFGHQDDPLYGVGWWGEPDRSDVKSVCGDYPAVMGFEIGHIELGDAISLDSVPFKSIRREIVKHHNRGGIVTISWHLDNPLTGGSSWTKPETLQQEKQTVASILPNGEMHQKFMGWLDIVVGFLNSLKTRDGEKIPVIFRPWHEHTGSWFWWGQDLCTTDQYIDLWRMTVNYLREKGVDNALFAYSPGTECNGDAARYLERYPGDDYIDLIGFDPYCSAKDGDEEALDGYSKTLDTHLDMLSRISKEHGKAMAVTETGYGNLPTDNWWTKNVLDVLKKYNVSYVLVWRNEHTGSQPCFAPYPGQRSAEDFKRFYEDKHTLFLNEIINTK